MIKDLLRRLSSTLVGGLTLAIGALLATIALSYAVYAGLAAMLPQPEAGGLTAAVFAVTAALIAILIPRLLGVGAAPAAGRAGAQMDSALVHTLAEVGASAADLMGDIMLERRASQARKRKLARKRRR